MAGLDWLVAMQFCGETDRSHAKIGRMRLDHMVRLIEGADASSFREIALLYLNASGYESVELTDGPRDAGTDVALWNLGSNPEPLAVQVSVQRAGWQGKVRQDAQRASDVLGRKNFLYVTSRRIAPADRAPLEEELYARQGVTLRIVDCQAIASKFLADGTSTQILKALGIPIGSPEAKKNRFNIREDLAYTYAFFGADVAAFREAAFDRSIAAFLVRATTPQSREETVAGVVRALQLGRARRGLVEARVDAMIQRGDLRVANGQLHVSDRLADAQRSARAVRERQWHNLKRSLSEALSHVGLFGARLEKTEELVAQAAGSLMLRAAESAGAAVRPSADTGPAKQQMWIQLRKLENGLVNRGLDPSAAADLVPKLTNIVALSDLGQTLLAGELFLSLLDMEGSNLMRALGGHEALEVFFDASVAIPILASLLYEPQDEHFFRAAHAAYMLALGHGVTLFLPRDYLEEAASHLLEAWEVYRPILEADPDLQFSKNAFVAHYLALRHEKKHTGSFESYLQSFGLRTATGPTRSFSAERDWIMSRMRTLFVRYGIAVAEPGLVSSQALQAAQSAITFTAKELHLERKGLLLQHDARAVADIGSRAAAGEVAVLFCTWDRLHLRLRTAGGPVEWNAMDPVVLADLLALASDDDVAALQSAVDTAMEFGESEARRGAEIWDEIIRIEQQNLYDAELMQQAKAFKDSYLESSRSSEKREPLAASWLAWKAHGDAGS
jgi:hypothetical protein